MVKDLDRPFYVVDGKEYCEETEAVKQLLVADVISLGESFPGGGEIRLYITCNDMFGYAIADAEDLHFSEIGSFYKMYENNGILKWLCLKRNMQPIDPMIKYMQEHGQWDEELERLPYNPSKGVKKVKIQDLCLGAEDA